MTTYQTRKEAARAAALEWNHRTTSESLSYSEIADALDKLEALARRYGLVREFRENGVI